MPTGEIRRAALPPRQLRVRSMRGLTAASALGHTTESFIWNGWGACTEGPSRASASCAAGCSMRACYCCGEP
jgi:hypothetical protein